MTSAYGFGILPVCPRCGQPYHARWNAAAQHQDLFCPPCAGLVPCPADHALYPRCLLCKGSGFVEAV